MSSSISVTDQVLFCLPYHLSHVCVPGMFNLSALKKVLDTMPLQEQALSFYITLHSPLLAQESEGVISRTSLGTHTYLVASSGIGFSHCGRQDPGGDVTLILIQCGHFYDHFIATSKIRSS